MIYQLAKTTVGLTGQVKWDLIVNNSHVVDLQIVPIHEDVNFNYTQREDTLNYTHIQNLNRLYKKTQGQFFEPVVDRKLNTGYPVRNEGTRVDTCEHSYDMGMKRNKSYKRYNKQFSFFCPFFCDSIDDINKLSFRIVLENNKGIKLCEKPIDISYIKEYVNQYVNEVQLNNDFIYLNFQDFNSWVKGVNVECAKVETKEQLGLIETLLQQERPLMEVDNLILKQFSDNYLIAPQLFNFNFIYNIEDILVPELIDDLTGENINTYVDIYKDDEKVEFKDIYSNYEFIPKYSIDEDSYTWDNCLDYLRDYANVNMIGQNKLVQSTFHWSLQDNPKYLFNLYDGCAPTFRGYSNSKLGDSYSTRGLYFDTPDVTCTEFNGYKNPLSWLNIKVISKDKPINIFELTNEVSKTLTNYETEYIKFDPSTTGEVFWINNIKVNNDIDWTDVDKNPLYFKIIYSNQTFIDDRSTVEDNFKTLGDVRYGEMYYGQDPENWKGHSNVTNNTIYYIISNSKNGKDDILTLVIPKIKGVDLTVTRYFEDTDAMSNFMISNLSNGSLLNMLSNYERYTNDEKSKDIIKSFNAVISKIVSKVVIPNTITFHKVLGRNIIKRPKALNNYITKNEEFEYMNADGFSYVLRYDGRLYPYFIDASKYIHNYIYSTKQYNQQINVVEYSDEDMCDFNTYTKTKFSPIYRSLDYFPLKHRQLDYKTPTTHNTGYVGEISWFKKNGMYFLPEEVIIQYTDSELKEETINNLLKHYLKKRVNYSRKTTKKIQDDLFNHFILPLYEVEYKFDYINNKTIDKYRYLIKYTLK